MTFSRSVFGWPWASVSTRTITLSSRIGLVCTNRSSFSVALWVALLVIRFSVLTVSSAVPFGGTGATCLIFLLMVMVSFCTLFELATRSIVISSIAYRGVSASRGAGWRTVCTCCSCCFSCCCCCSICCCWLWFVSTRLSSTASLSFVFMRKSLISRKNFAGKLFPLTCSIEALLSGSGCSCTASTSVGC
uniref:Uncharacterized protein n=1 Tax=Anopheles atroparvus TaxID=41427 RepID=A0AAG5D8Y0_ANOAO